MAPLATKVRVKTKKQPRRSGVIKKATKDVPKHTWDVEFVAEDGSKYVESLKSSQLLRDETAEETTEATAAEETAEETTEETAEETAEDVTTAPVAPSYATTPLDPVIK